MKLFRALALFFALSVALAAQPAGAAGGWSNSPWHGPGWSKASAVGGGATALMNVATGNEMPASLSAASTYTMCRKGHIARDNITSLQLVHWNGYGSANLGEVANSALPITGEWVEYPVGTYIQASYAGATAPTLAAGALVTTDPVTVTIPNGSVFYTWVRAGPGTVPAVGAAGQTQLHSSDEGCTSSTTSASVPSAPSGTVPGTRTFDYLPTVAILANTSVKSWLIFGDSRVYGQGDTADANFNKGSYAKVICPTYACGNGGVAGDTGSAWLGGGASSARSQISQFYTHILDEYGTNDAYVETGVSAGIQGYGLRRSARFNGKPYVRATVEPIDSSSDSFATPTSGSTTPNNQTQNTNWAALSAWNGIIRAATDAPWVENEYPVENISASGYWSAGNTGDGLHANTTGTAAQVTYGLANWLTTLSGATNYATAWAPTATANSATFTATGCALGQANCLNGGNVANYGMGPTGTSWTIEFWMKTSTTASGYVIGNSQQGMSIAATTFVPTAIAGTRSMTGASSVSDGVWHQYDIVQTATGGTLYQDCTSIASVATAPAGMNLTGQAFGIRAQGRPSLTGSTQQVNNTTMQEVSTWNYAKPCVLQSAPYAGTEPGLIALLHLNNDVSMVVGPDTGARGSSATKLDLQFASGTYAKNGLSYSSLTAIPGASVSTPAAFAYTSTGALVSKSANAGRVDTGGLLIEQASTNVNAHSGDITAAPGGSYQGTISSPGATGPDGSTTAQQFLPNTATDLHNIYADYALTANTRYTFSALVKPIASMTTVRLDAVDPSDANGYFGRANISSGGITSSGVLGSGTLNASYTVAAGSGWYNAAISGKVDASTTDIYTEIYGVNPANATNDNYAGNGTDGFYVWHQQTELLPFGTSPIRTSGTSATRAADDVSVSSVTPPSGPFHIDVGFTTTRAVGQARTLFDWNDGTDNNKLTLTMDSTNHLVLTAINGGSSTTAATEGGSPAAARTATATIYRTATQWCLSVGGASAGCTTAAAPAVTTLQVGQNRAKTQALNDLLTSLTIYGG